MTKKNTDKKSETLSIPAVYEFPFFAMNVKNAWSNCVSFYEKFGVRIRNTKKTASRLHGVKTILFDECAGLTADVPTLKAGNWTPSELRVACHMAMTWDSPLSAGLLNVMGNVGWNVDPWDIQTTVDITGDDVTNTGVGIVCSRPDGVYMLGDRDFVVRDGVCDDVPTLWLFIPSGKRIAFRFEYK